MMKDNIFTYFYNRNCLSFSSLLSINSSSVRTITFQRWLIRNAVYYTIFTKFLGKGIGCCCLRFMSLLPIECQLENKMAAVFFLQKNKNVNNACAKVPEFSVVWLTINFKL